MALHDREDINIIKATKIASRQAYEMAGINAKDISLACVHDCFTSAEMLATEDLGFFEPGRGKGCFRGKNRSERR